jgi:hypothetical protein
LSHPIEQTTFLSDLPVGNIAATNPREIKLLAALPYIRDGCIDM